MKGGIGIDLPSQVPSGLLLQYAILIYCGPLNSDVAAKMKWSWSVSQ